MAGWRAEVQLWGDGNRSPRRGFLTVLIRPLHQLHLEWPAPGLSPPSMQLACCCRPTSRPRRQRVGQEEAGS